MALTATLYHLDIALSDSDRGVYEALDLRVARHPSETMRYMLARTVALCLLWEDGIAFSKGLSTNDEPAVWLREPDGRIRLWVDVGQPGAERLHKASKAAARVVVCTYPDRSGLERSIAGARIHRAEHIEVLALPAALLDELSAVTDKKTHWDFVHTGGQIYVTVGNRTVEGPVTRTALVASP
jgi:uncharacterized protein YaeQ